MENSPLQMHPEHQHDDAMELRKHIAILRGRFWTIFACVVVVFSVSAIRTFRARPMYESSARLLIERRLPRLTPFDGAAEYASWYFFDTQAQLITSRDVLEKAMENPELAALFKRSSGSLEAERPGLFRSVFREVRGLMHTEPTRPLEPWERLRGSVSTRKVSNTDLVDVRSVSANPRNCAIISNAVAEAYVAYSIELRQRTAVDTFDALQALKQEQERALSEAEDALFGFQEESAMTEAGLPRIEGNVKERMSALNNELTRVQMRRLEISVKAEAARSMRDNLDGNPATLGRIGGNVNNARVTSLLDSLRNLEIEERRALSVYGPRHPNIKALEYQRELINDQITEAVAGHAAAMETEYALLIERERELNRVLSDINRAALDVNRSSIQYERLRNDVERHRKVFDVILDRMRQVDLGKGTDLTNIKLVEKASVPTSPFRPNRQRSLAVGLMLGLMLGLGLAYLHEWLDDSIKSPEDIERRLGMPLLGFVQEMQSEGIAGDGLAAVATHALNSPFSVISESLRSIRTNIYFSGAKDERRSIMITSPGPGEGKTVTTCNLAVTLAQDGNRVLLVDGDLRRPRVHTAFGLDRKPGLTNMLVEGGELEELVSCPVDEDGKKLENLHILCAGVKSPNPAELLGGAAMARFMEEVKEKYDIVIYDSGAALMIADSTLLANRCDAVVLVAKAGSSRRTMLARLKKLFDSANCRIIGAVLNDVRPGSLRSSYGYGGYYYGYGYGYGYYRQDEGETADEDGQVY